MSLVASAFSLEPRYRHSGGSRWGVKHRLSAFDRSRYSGCRSYATFGRWRGPRCRRLCGTQLLRSRASSEDGAARLHDDVSVARVSDRHGAVVAVYPARLRRNDAITIAFRTGWPRRLPADVGQWKPSSPDDTAERFLELAPDARLSVAPRQPRDGVFHCIESRSVFAVELERRPHQYRPCDGAPGPRSRRLAETGSHRRLRGPARAGRTN